MSENQKKILEMLAQNKISVEDAHRLLGAIDSGDTVKDSPVRTETETKGKAKYLRVTVMPSNGHENAENVDRVNVRVPMSLIRAGIKLTSLIPGDALNKVNDSLREKGINFDVRSIKPDDIEELIDALGDLQVDVDSARGEKVKVFVEY